MRRRWVPSARFPDELHSKVLIKVGYACNSDCVFCHVDHYRGAPKSEKAIVLKKMLQIKQRGFDMVALSGGEVTIRHEVDEWAKAAKGYGLLLGLVSNGRRMADPAYTRFLHDQGLRYAYISFYGATREVHNYLAGGMDCWQEQIDGVRHLAGYPDIDLTLNVIMCKQNLPELRGIVDLFADLHHIRIKFSALEPKGAAWDNFDTITPHLADSAAAAKDAIEYGESLGRENLDFGIDGLPPCLVGDAFHRRYNDNLMTHGIYYMTETWEEKFYHVDDLNKKHLEPCHSCAVNYRCPGVHLGYENKSHADALEPFSYEHRERYTLASREPLDVWSGVCPYKATDRQPPSDPGTVMFVEDGHLHLGTIDVGGGHANDVERLKRDLGQVHFPGSAGTFHEGCLDCEKSLTCSLMVVPKADARPLEPSVRRFVGQFTGRMLDVGGGFSRAFPEEALTLRDRGVTLEICDDLPDTDETEPFDAVVVFDAAHRLYDQAAAFREVTRLLRPEGTLLVSQRLGHILLAVDAESRPWRHVASQPIVTNLEDAGLTLEKHLPVRPGTPDRWVVVMRRPRVPVATPRPAMEASRA